MPPKLTENLPRSRAISITEQKELFFPIKGHYYLAVVLLYVSWSTTPMGSLIK
jgi:hypothetical protein